jgi:serine phosphatase RsbU (regulator of sigma subunit)
MGGIGRTLGELAEGWGRRVAWAVLIVFLLIEAGFGSALDGPRLALFDLYERTFPRRQDSTPVVIVAVDDASLKSIGQWPWPRQIDAALISRILAGNPAALGIDMIWSEPDRDSPAEWLKEAGNIPQPLADGLRGLPSHDDVLRDALAAGPVVIGLGGVRHDRDVKDAGRLPPFRQIGGTNLPIDLTNFTSALRSLPELDRAAAGHGLLSVDPDRDGVFRRLPAIATISGRLAPSLAVEMIRIVAQAPAIDLRVAGDRTESVTVGPIDIPTEPDGTVWVDFTRHEPQRFVSAADVLAGRVPADRFDRRLVFIGVTALGEVDQRLTPVGVMPGTELHAQLLENIFAQRFARRPGWTRAVELALILAIGVGLIAAVPRFRARGQPLAALLPILVLAAFGFAMWHDRRLLVDVATPALADAAVFIALIGGEFAEADTQRRRLRRELQVHMLAEAKAEGELEAGRRIQTSLLPLPESVAGDHRFDLGALMIPARHIGGDLYDFFKIDDNRLYFAVGDVSGKGVAAALFMALGKSLCKSAALRGETDIGAIVNRANAEISRDNPEMMFITMFAGILDMQTGELTFCNAGHDPPTVLDDFRYAEERFTLRPGDIVCLTTDGVTEAMTEAGQLMGKARMEAALAGLPSGVTAHTVADRLHAAVGDFVAGAEASDDLTILTIRWHGPSER